MLISEPSHQHLVAGLIAGMASTLTSYPLELMKTRMQVTSKSIEAYRSLYSTLKSVLKYEGVMGLYKGMNPALIASTGSWGGYFYIYELSKTRKLQHKNSNNSSNSDNNQNVDTGTKLNTIDHLFAGTEAGIVMVLVFNPLWVIRTRMALQGAEPSTIHKYKGTIDALRTIWKEEGIRGLYKGLFPALLLTSHGSIQFAVYEAMKVWLADTENRFINKNKSQPLQQSPLGSMILGAVSKIIASTITYPYQVIKSRLQQRQVHHHQQQHLFNPSASSQPSSTVTSNTKAVTDDFVIIGRSYRSTWDCTVSIYKQEGMRGYFRGIGPNVVKVAPGAAVTFLVYEECMKYMKS